VAISGAGLADPQNLPTVPVLTLALAQQAATAANAACQNQGFAVTATIVDASGTVVAQLRNDGATAATVDVSKGKAYAAAGFKSPTAALRESAKTNPGFIAIPQFVILAGGLPVSSAGKVVGAIGVAGAPTDDIDQTCAQAGLDAMNGSAGSPVPPSGSPLPQGGSPLPQGR
jgi:uncharacterized protein GlcG (DUF336 family)